MEKKINSQSKIMSTAKHFCNHNSLAIPKSITFIEETKQKQHFCIFTKARKGEAIVAIMEQNLNFNGVVQ